MPPRRRNRSNRTDRGFFPQDPQSNRPQVVADSSISNASGRQALPDLLSSFVGQLTPGWLQRYRSERERPKTTGHAFIMPRDVTGLENLLAEISRRVDVPAPTRQLAGQAVVANFCSAITAGRASDRVTVLLLGGAAHGKSQTINKLLGRPDFLETGRRGSAPTRVDSGVVPFTCDGVASTMTFDEIHDPLAAMDVGQTRNVLQLSRYTRLQASTPGSPNDLITIMDAMRLNGETSAPRLAPRSEVFPNAVLVVSRWADVRMDAQNDVDQFTTQLGHAILAIKSFDLYDIARPNIIVVVTRALGDPMADFEEEGGTATFDDGWRVGAQAKRDVVHAIQQKVYPRSKSWPVVFVENGSGAHDFSTWNLLPNGEQSHQNLFNALRGLFEQMGRQGLQDLLGLRSLASVMAGLERRIGDTPVVLQPARINGMRVVTREGAGRMPGRNAPAATFLELREEPSLLGSTLSEIGHYVSDVSLPWLRLIGSSGQNHPSINIPNPFDMPANVDELKILLDQIPNRRDLRGSRTRIIRDIIGNFCSAFVAGRACSRVTVLLFGETGQGKSATINKLVGQEIFETGRDSSTTKDINSVTRYAVRNGIRVALAFDDTPGLEDTRAADRQRNASTLLKYAEAFTRTRNEDQTEEFLRYLTEIGYGVLTRGLAPYLRPTTHPNAILLTVTWDNIKDEGDNPPDQPTTVVGRTMRALHQSRLYDPGRPNVIVTVTRAITQPKDYLGRHFGDRWSQEAENKRRLIHRTQKKHFPATVLWPVVFVENGASEESFDQYEFFPDGRQSHQNLFDELRTLFNNEVSQSGTKDLLGLQALATVISGGPHLDGTLETSTVVQMEREETRPVAMEIRQPIAPIIPQQNFGPVPLGASLSALLESASPFIGKSYNPVRKEFSRHPFIDTTGDIQVIISPGEDFDHICETRHDELFVTPAQLDVSHKIRHQKLPRPQVTRGGPLLPGWSQFHAYKVVGIASLGSGPPRVLEEWERVIAQLPSWNESNESVRSQYERFFDQTGTHIVVAAGLGGRVVIRLCERFSLDTESLTSKLQGMGEEDPPRSPLGGISTIEAQRRTAIDELEISIKGGGDAHISVRMALAKILQRLATPPATGEWRSARLQWVTALHQDAVVFPHLPQTKYRWIHSLEGITPSQQHNLRQASGWYLKIRRRRQGHTSPPTPRPIPAPSPVARPAAMSTLAPTEPKDVNVNQAAVLALDRSSNRRTTDGNFEEGQRGFWVWLRSQVPTSCVIQ